MTRAPLSTIRALFADAVCGVRQPVAAQGEGAGATHRLRGVELFPHQLNAVRRARDAIARFGGALLADDVGAGKTFVALAIASSYSRPVVLAPAVLRPMWTRAMTRTSTTMPFVSLESLGRGRPPPVGHDLVIVDEAHHLRNPATQRYAGAQRMVVGAHVLLASATPVHNLARDLDSLLALFLRADAADLDGEARACVIVRSAPIAAAPAATDAWPGAPPAATPAVQVHPPMPVPDDKCVIAAIQRLPPPVRPSDGGDAPALFRIALLRAWCSSAAAVGAMLVRATHAAAALSDALRSRRTLTRSELGAWSLEDGQLAFTEMFGTASVRDTTRALGDAESHLDRLRELRSTVDACAAIDCERARLLRSVFEAHSPTPVLACAQYAATVSMLWRHLRVLPGVALLTSRGARIASGAITRDDALRRFAPCAHGVRTPHARERITLLLATDLVSEGLNLQDAGVVVHLDLPWTAARLAQRVGRVARIGSLHGTVHVYTMQPPRAAAALLALERRIRVKRALGEQLVGGRERTAALLGCAGAGGESEAEARARVVQILQPYAHTAHGDCVIDEQRDSEQRDSERRDSEWRDSEWRDSEWRDSEWRDSEWRDIDGRAICAVRAPQHGWVGLVGTRIVAKLGKSRPTTAPQLVLRAVELLAAATEECEPGGAARALSQLARWLSNERARELSSAHRRNAARVHGRAIATTVGSVSAASAHERVGIAAAAQAKMAELGAQRGALRADLQFPISNFQSPIRPARRIIALVLFSTGDQNRNSL